MADSNVEQVTVQMVADQILSRLGVLENKVRVLESTLRDVGAGLPNAPSASDPPVIPTDHPLIIRIPGVRGGEPITRHAKVSVRIIVESVRQGETPEQIWDAYTPYLSRAEISDALSYYLQHTKEIDGYIAEHQAALERVTELSRLASERKLAEKRS